MEKRARSAIASGAILVALGVLLLVARLVPGFWGDLTWPFIVIGVGVLLLVLAVATGNAGLAVPGCIVGGIGLILWWQNTNNQWETWAYAWTLIPGFVGVGALVQGLLEAKPLKALPGRALARHHQRDTLRGVRLLVRRPAARHSAVLPRRRRADPGRHPGHPAGVPEAPRGTGTDAAKKE